MMQVNTKKINTICLVISVLFFCAHKLHAQQLADKKNIVFTVYHCKDTSINIDDFKLKTQFENEILQQTYLNNLPRLLSIKGYAACAIDSFWRVNEKLHAEIYFGKQYKLIQMRTIGAEKALLAKAGFDSSDYINKPLNFDLLNNVKEKLLSICENEGYPFANIYLDSISIKNENVQAILKIDKVYYYPIDSIKNSGNLKLNPNFLQRFLNIKNGSAYELSKLKLVDKRIAELPYAETTIPSYLEMFGTGATLRLNVNSKKSSEASAIIGFLPSANNTGKYAFTGDVNFDFKNLFGAGEGLVLKYQSLQPKSPRLNIGIEKPYIFNTPYGINFLFDFFKKDSSFYQLNAQLGVQLNLNFYQSAKLYVQFQNTTLLPSGIDTNSIKFQKKLPNIIDVRATNFGVLYEFKNTNYKFNPLTGNEISINGFVGIKNTIKNNNVVSLYDPVFNFNSLYDSLKLQSYQFKIKLSAAHYFKLKKSATLKTALQSGIYNSPNIFRNDVFQIGGNKLLRGFDEESIYATRYAVSTIEARLLTGLNSYFFGFIDAALTNTNFFNVSQKNSFLSTGIGTLFETKAGILNLSFAIGKRNDLPFNLRQAAKIHFGYINYF